MDELNLNQTTLAAYKELSFKQYQLCYLNNKWLSTKLDEQPSDRLQK